MPDIANAHQKAGSGLRSFLSAIPFSPTALDIAVLALVWVLLGMLVNPSGEFPLNDDWDHSHPVRSLLTTGRMEADPFTDKTLIAQVLWGTLFCVPFGFSFFALRLSTFVLGLAGILATYALAKELNSPRAFRLLAAITLALNPLYFQLSLTFMTDVPFLALTLLSVFFIMRAMRRESQGAMLLGLLFCCLALLIRQLALVIPLAFALAYVVRKHLNARVMVIACLPTVTALAILLVHHRWVQSMVDSSALHLRHGNLYNKLYISLHELAPAGWLGASLVCGERLLVELLYLGTFTLPVGIVLAASKLRNMSAKRRCFWMLSGVLMFALAMGGLLWQGRVMPLSGTVWFDIGLGPPTLRDVYNLRLPHFPRAPQVFWLFVTGAGVAGGFLLLSCFWWALSRAVIGRRGADLKDEMVPLVFAGSALGLYTGLMAVAGFYDRYLLFLVPFAMVLAAIVASRRELRCGLAGWLIAGMVLIGYGVFSLAATHDYLSWNRARWEALNLLTQRWQLSHTVIDGGYEFNAWYGYNGKYREKPGKSWWWVEDDEYIVAFGPIAGYSEVLRYPYVRWIPSGEGNILVLRRLPRVTGDEVRGNSALPNRGLPG